MMGKKAMGVLIVGGVVLVAVLWGPIMSNVEQPKYDVVLKDGAIEVRDYAPQIIAQVKVGGTRDEAISKGFKKVAGYIFGGNQKAESVAMTAPVLQTKSEKIAMTAPVTQQKEGSVWTVAFIMPSSYTMATLPKPEDADVQLMEVPAQRKVALRFSGFYGDEKLKQKTADLMAYVQTHNLTPVGEVTYAFYNPPWTLPPLRRNEVMVGVGTKP